MHALFIWLYVHSLHSFFLFLFFSQIKIQPFFVSLFFIMFLCLYDYQATWLGHFPMVKAVLRGMDTVTAFVNTLSDVTEAPVYYSVGGESKRGWTTWLVGAVDSGRVKAIVPIVLDAINIIQVGSFSL